MKEHERDSQVQDEALQIFQTDETFIDSKLGTYVISDFDFNNYLMSLGYFDLINIQIYKIYIQNLPDGLTESTAKTKNTGCDAINQTLTSGIFQTCTS